MCINPLKSFNFGSPDKGTSREQVRGAATLFGQKKSNTAKSTRPKPWTVSLPALSQPVYLCNMLFSRCFQALCMRAPSNSFMTIPETCLDAEIK